MARYWVGGSGSTQNTAHWSATSGGAGGASVPTSSDDVTFDSNSGLAGATITNPSPYLKARNLTFNSGASYTFDNLNLIYINGSLVMESTMICSRFGAVFTASSGSFTITTNGFSHIDPTFECAGATYTLQDNWTADKYFIFYAGSFNANGYNLTFTGFDIEDLSGAVSITMGSGTWQASTYFSVVNDGSLTLTANTSTVKLITGSTSFAGSGLTYHNLWIQATNVSVTGANTFNDIKIDPNLTTYFYPDTTQTVSTFTVVGTPGNLITLNSLQVGAILTYHLSDGGSSYSVGDQPFVGNDADGAAQIYVDSVDGSGAILTFHIVTLGTQKYPTGNQTLIDAGDFNAVFTIDSVQIDQFTLSKSSGIVNCDYLVIQNSNVTGGADWFAGFNSVDEGDNTGWQFRPSIISPIVSFHGITTPYPVISSLLYVQSALGGNNLPVSGGEVSNLVYFRVYNNYAGSEGVATMYNVQVTVFDGAGSGSHTGMQSPASQSWVRIYETGFGENSTPPGLYTQMMGQDTAIGFDPNGSQGIYIPEVCSSGSLSLGSGSLPPGNAYIRAGVDTNGVGFLEFATYVEAPDIIGFFNYSFAVSILYDFST